jgi:hypothetical protein
VANAITGTSKVLESIPRECIDFFSHVKYIEDIDLANQPCKRSKTWLNIPKRFSCQLSFFAWKAYTGRKNLTKQLETNFMTIRKSTREKGDNIDSSDDIDSGG